MSAVRRGRQDACATTIYGRLRSEVAREVSRHLPTSLLSSDNSGSTKGVRIAKCAVLLAGRAREERRIDGLLVDTQRAMHGARRIRTNCPRVRRGREGAKPTPRRNPRRDSPLPAPCEQTVRLFCPDAGSGPKSPAEPLGGTLDAEAPLRAPSAGSVLHGTETTLQACVRRRYRERQGQGESSMAMFCVEDRARRCRFLGLVFFGR